MITLRKPAPRNSIGPELSGRALEGAELRNHRRAAGPLPQPPPGVLVGIHFCLGQQLARVETQSALTRLYARFHDLQLAAPDRIEWTERLGLRGVKTLPLKLNATARRLAT